MRGINKQAVSAALAVGLFASAFVADKAEANSHISVGIGFGVPVYVEPAAPVYYAPGYYYGPRGHLHWR